MTDWMIQDKAIGHLKDLLAVEEGLTDREVDFIEKMAALNRAFTKREMKRIYEIYEARC